MTQLSPSGVDISIPDLSPSLEVYNSYFPQDIVTEYPTDI